MELSKVTGVIPIWSYVVLFLIVMGIFVYFYFFHVAKEPVIDCSDDGTGLGAMLNILYKSENFKNFLENQQESIKLIKCIKDILENYDKNGKKSIKYKKFVELMDQSGFMIAEPEVGDFDRSTVCLFLDFFFIFLAQQKLMIDMQYVFSFSKFSDRFRSEQESHELENQNQNINSEKRISAVPIAPTWLFVFPASPKKVSDADRTKKIENFHYELRGVVCRRPLQNTFAILIDENGKITEQEKYCSNISEKSAHLENGEMFVYERKLEKNEFIKHF